MVWDRRYSNLIGGVGEGREGGRKIKISTEIEDCWRDIELSASDNSEAAMLPEKDIEIRRSNLKETVVYGVY